MCVDAIPCQSQHPQPLALALWEEPWPLATKVQDALRKLDELFGTLLTVEEPSEW